MVSKRRKKSNKKSTRNTIISYILVIVAIGLVGFLVLENIQENQKRQKLTFQARVLQQKIRELKEKKQFLESTLSESEKQEYIEKQAREKLNLQKSGEKAVAFVLPTEESTTELPEKKNPWHPKTWWGWAKNIWPF